MARVLVVEDDAAIRRLVTAALEREGHQVVVAEDGSTALVAHEREKPDAVVLDLGLPDIHGFEVCRRLREREGTPILILTALSAEEQILQGFQVGADDYLTKPFSIRVFQARVAALLRRRRQSPRPATSHEIEVGDLKIDLARKRMFVRGESVDVTPSQFRLISYLVRHVGQVVSSAELLEEIQDYTTAEREAQEVIKVHIRHLRNKIETDPASPRYIRTVRGFGYMLDNPVSQTLTSR